MHAFSTIPDLCGLQLIPRCALDKGEVRYAPNHTQQPSPGYAACVNDFAFRILYLVPSMHAFSTIPDLCGLELIPRCALDKGEVRYAPNHTQQPSPGYAACVNDFAFRILYLVPSLWVCPLVTSA